MVSYNEVSSAMKKVAIREFVESLPKGQKQELGKVLMEMGFNEVIIDAVKEVKEKKGDA